MSIFINHKPLETFNFSGGECHVKISPSDIGGKTEILAYLNTANDIMNLLLAVDAIRRINPESSIELTIPYFPYARQDRVCNEGEALSVKVMANLVNSLHCDTVTIYDPHSDVTPALLDHCQIITLSDIVANSKLVKIIHENELILLSPDAGSEKKIHATAKKVSNQKRSIEVICASKTRDTKTGDITATHIYGDVKDKSFIILDDICDGGRTFIEIAKVLRSKGSLDVYLYVTHGIFSKGLDVLKSYFKHVYCYHTMLSQDKIDNSFLTILAPAHQ